MATTNDHLLVIVLVSDRDSTVDNMLVLLMLLMMTLRRNTANLRDEVRLMLGYFALRLDITLVF